MMKRNQLVKTLFFLTSILLCDFAAAEIYKCTSFDSQSNKQITVYTDEPCAKQVKQTLVDIQGSANNITVMDDGSPLDLKIARAVLMEDFNLAKSLATSKEHWRLISMAEGKQKTSVKTIPIIERQVATQDDCAIARKAYESTASARRRDEDLIATKKNSMFAACGVTDTQVPNNVVVVGGRYGGIQSPRWRGIPYGAAGYVKPRGKRYQHYRTNRINRGGGLSIQYQNKRLGLRAQSGGLQNQTDIRQQFRTKNFALKQHSNIRQQFR